MHGPVTVDDTLRIAGGPAGVAHGGGGAFVHVRPVETVRLRSQQLTIGVHRATVAAEGAQRRGVGIAWGACHDHVADRLSVREDLGKQRDQAGVNDHHMVAGVGGDVADGLGL